MLDYIINDGWRFEVVEVHGDHLIVEKEGKLFKSDKKTRDLEPYARKRVKANQRYAERMIKRESR
ncbi:hypothetical protein P7H75_02890 [Vagococcus carniphilus]|uniref:hypothetical protein n=1 Tax=Vagococcus carniphilus TaxID=218144 RepID=UPI0028911D70|nr:hypothetical protein [Vagococcus carniphilus]MDT2813778.1 hypothetical protein [Vagococcus carniphilus]